MNEAIILTLRSGYGEFGMWRHAIRTGNYFAIPLELRIKLMLVLEQHCIDAMVFFRIAIHNDIRRHIFRNAATCLNQHPTTDVAVLMQDDIAAQDRAVVYAAVACHCALDAQYAVIANLYVVAEVNTVH